MVYRALDILGRQVDRITPDRLDLVGGLIRLSGIAIIMYWPR
jgi:drug/metabolite transporter superfamily protein YnfA